MVAAVVAVFAADLCTATDHIVGGNHGWNTQHQLLPVSGNQTFYVGDLISFRYQKGTRNVFEVNKTGYEYDNCTMKVAITVHPLPHNAASRRHRTRPRSARHEVRRCVAAGARGRRCCLVLGLRSLIPSIL